MNLLGQDIWFWIISTGAAIVKVATSPFYSIWRAIMTVGAALFAAFVFTEPALDLLGLDPEVYRNGVAAILALTGEGLMRAAIQASQKPQSFLAEMIRKVVNGK